MLALNPKNVLRVGILSVLASPGVFWQSSILVRADDAEDKEKEDAELDALDKEEDETPTIDEDSEPPKVEAVEDHVVALTDSTFGDFIKKNERVLVEYYAPWCGHCKMLEPEYKRAAAELKKKKRKTILAKVDATIEAATAQEAGVQGYPTLYYYVNGEKSEYEGGRDQHGIVSWVEAKEKDPVLVCGKDTIEKAKTGEPVENADGDEVKHDFIVVAEVGRKTGKATAVKKAMAAIIAAKKGQSIYACYDYLPKGADEKKSAKMTMVRTKAFDEEDKVISYSGVWNAGKVESWIVGGAYDLVGVFDTVWYTDLQKVGADYVVMAAAPHGKLIDNAKRTLFVSEMKKLIKDKKYSKFRFAIAEGGVDRKEQVGQITDDAIIILESNRKDGPAKKWLTSPAVPAAIGSFIDSFLGGKLKPTYKSQQLTPEQEMEDGVRVLTGDSFEKIAYDPKKDVFVEFYAPWCGHCKKLAPEWTRLAAKMKALKVDDKVTIAKMDATENECEVEIQGFPKLVLFPAVKNSAKLKKEYTSGERTMEPMLEFLVENAKNLAGVEVDLDEKVDKGSFSMVGRELKKKKEAALKKDKKQEL